MVRPGQDKDFWQEHLQDFHQEFSHQAERCQRSNQRTRRKQQEEQKEICRRAQESMSNTNPILPEKVSRNNTKAGPFTSSGQMDLLGFLLQLSHLDPGGNIS